MVVREDVREVKTARNWLRLTRIHVRMGGCEVRHTQGFALEAAEPVRFDRVLEHMDACS